LKRHAIATLILTAFAALAMPVLADGAEGTRFHLAREVVLGGDGSWDYLAFEPASGRLYVSRSSHVDAVDPDSGKVIGTVADTPGVHGIALAPELGKGFTSNGRDGTVTIFDLKSLQSRRRVTAGSNPDAILFEPTTKRVFAFNGGSHDVTVIDAATEEVVRTVPVGGKPEFAVADGRGRVFVNVEDTSEVLAIDAQQLRVTARWPVAPCEGPTGISMDTTRRRLFVGCSNRLMAIVDADTGRLITTVTVGAGTDATAYDSRTNLAFSSNGDGTLTVVGEDEQGHFAVADNISTKAGARTLALDSARQRIYLVTASFGPRPAATAEQPRPRPPMLPGTFTLLVVER
jgi:YVTN family beta-propeller protein